MEDKFSEFEEKIFLTDNEVCTKIWTSPREVFSFIIQSNYNKYFYLLLFLGGISNALDRASLKNMGDTESLSYIIIISVLGGGLLGWISYYLYAMLVSWTGRWLGGKASKEAIFKIFAYSLIPSIFALPLIGIQILLFDQEYFSSSPSFIEESTASFILFTGLSILEFVLGFWSFVICIAGVSEIQKISISKAILNLFLPLLIFAIPIAILIFMATSL